MVRTKVRRDDAVRCVRLTAQGYSDLLRRNLRILSTNNLSVPWLLHFIEVTQADQSNFVKVGGGRCAVSNYCMHT
jgi:hypothetical protein